MALTWPDESYSGRVLKILRAAAAGNYLAGMSALQLEVTINNRRGKQQPVPAPSAFGFNDMRELLLRMETDGVLETQTVGQNLIVRASKATREGWSRLDAASSGARQASTSSPRATVKRVTTGLRNMGNTCYINAIIQVQLHVYT